MSDEASRNDQYPKIFERTPRIEASIGAQIRILRIASGMTQSALGEAIGVSFQQLQKYEAGKVRVPASFLLVLATALGVHPGSFFGEKAPTPTGDLPITRTALQIAAGLQRISDPRICKAIVALIDVLAAKPEP